MAVKKSSRVDSICNYVKPRRKTWFDDMAEVDQKDLLEIRRKVQSQGLIKSVIARRLISEFLLTARLPTVLRWLGETDE